MYGYDYGWKDPRVLIEYGKTHADQYVAWDAYHVSGKPVEHAISWLQDNDKPVGPIYCDHDPEHIDKFRSAGYPAEAAEKDIDQGVQEVQSGRTSTDYETAEIENLRKRVRRLDPGDEFGHPGQIIRDTSRTVTATNDP